MSAEEVERYYEAAARRLRPPGADQLHVRGAEATVELAELAALREGERVLDVGAGLGGPARFIAERFGVDVTGVDVTAAFVERAEELTRDAGLADRVRFVRADATALPFADGAFAIGWTQHAAMNVRGQGGALRRAAPGHRPARALRRDRRDRRPARVPAAVGERPRAVVPRDRGRAPRAPRRSRFPPHRGARRHGDGEPLDARPPARPRVREPRPGPRRRPAPRCCSSSRTRPSAPWRRPCPAGPR